MYCTSTGVKIGLEWPWIETVYGALSEHSFILLNVSNFRTQRVNVLSSIRGLALFSTGLLAC